MAKNFVEVAPDLYLHTEREESEGGGARLTYELENAGGRAVHFVLDCTGSENFEVVGQETPFEEEEEDGWAGRALVMAVDCGPYQRMLLGRLAVVDGTRRASLKTNPDYHYIDTDPEKLREIIAQDKRAIQKLTETAKQLGLDQGRRGTAELEARCAAHSALFVDLEWPPGDRALWGEAGPPPAAAAAAAAGGPAAAAAAAGLVTWRRPRDWMRGKYKVFEDGIEPGDVRQGRLTDCWFLSALCALAEFPPLVERLFESPRTSEAGLYRVRLCVGGRWAWTLVDDYFPCFPGAGPVYSASHGNELWVLLLEKAYAKHYGSYQALRFGAAAEAMVDLTGCPWRVLDLPGGRRAAGAAAAAAAGGGGGGEEEEEELDEAALWVNLVRWDGQGYLMSVQTPGEPEEAAAAASGGALSQGEEEEAPDPAAARMGLLPGHAYTLLRAAALASGGGDRLVQLRNPWGRYEWTGAWSDGAAEWTTEARRELGVEGFEDDGAFWMALPDLRARFATLSLCQVRLEKPWIEQRRKVCFTYDNQ